MRKLDKNEMEIVNARLNSIKDLVSQIEKTSLPEILNLIDMLQKDKMMQSFIILGGTYGEPFCQFAGSSSSLDEELLFMLNWCKKGV